MLRATNGLAGSPLIQNRSAADVSLAGERELLDTLRFTPGIDGIKQFDQSLWVQHWEGVDEIVNSATSLAKSRISFGTRRRWQSRSTNFTPAGP